MSTWLGCLSEHQLLRRRQTLTHEFLISRCLPGERGGSALGVVAVAQRGRQVWAQHRSNVCQSFGRCRRPLIYACHMFLIIAPALVRVRRACGIACARAHVRARLRSARPKRVSRRAAKPAGIVLSLHRARLAPAPKMSLQRRRRRERKRSGRSAEAQPARDRASPRLATHLSKDVDLPHPRARRHCSARSIAENPPRKRPWSQTPSVFRQHRPQAG